MFRGRWTPEACRSKCGGDPGDNTWGGGGEKLNQTGKVVQSTFILKPMCKAFERASKRKTVTPYTLASLQKSLSLHLQRQVQTPSCLLMWPKPTKDSRSSSREVRIRVPFFLQSMGHQRPTPKDQPQMEPCFWWSRRETKRNFPPFSGIQPFCGIHPVFGGL